MIDIVFFDVETNGVKGSSVLSISAIKARYSVDGECRVLDEYNRFYFRMQGEMMNHDAIMINGLNDKVISQRRVGCDYPRYFIDDLDSFKTFCSGIKHYVAHNLWFDSSFVDFDLPNKFCTMKINTNIVKIPNVRGGNKWPSLKETASYYKIEWSDEKAHDSKYDVAVTKEIFTRMFCNKAAKRYVDLFMKCN